MDVEAIEPTATALAEAVPVMMWRAGPDRVSDYFNRRWLDYRGRTLEQESGMGWSEGLHADDLPGCIEVYKTSFEQRRMFEIEYRLRRHDGAFRWFLDSGAPWLSSAGDFLGYVGCCIDIDERKLIEHSVRSGIEALRKQNEELYEFAYGASHDLQEPLRTISTYTQLLKEPRFQNGNGSDETLKFIVDAVDRMRTLLSDLLNYSQALHRSETQPSEFDCNLVFDQVVLMCQAAIQETGAMITHDTLPVIEGDRAQVAQLLQNLITNAIKYRRPGERPIVHVSAVAADEGWLFCVKDNGIGFDPIYAERIFGLFKRLHGQERYSGTGLGLAICRKIVERHGGRIWATSEPGRGSDFCFTLPQ